MKFATLFSTALIALLLTVSASAQQGLQHPTEQGAQLVGTYPVALHMPKVGENKGSDVSTEILVWMTSDGQKELQLNPIVQVSGESGSGSNVIDNFTTSKLYAMLSQAAVSKGVALGFIQPNPEEVNVPVYRPNYVTRTGSGSNTQFAICGDGSWGVANYNVLFPVEGTVVVNLDDTEFATEFVNGTCESTFMEPIQNSISNNVSSLSNDSGSGAAVLAKSTKLDRVREKIRARRAAR